MCAARRGHQHLGGNTLRVGAQLPWVANADAESLAPFHGRGHKLAAQRSGYDHLHLPHRQAVAGQGIVVGGNIKIEATRDALGKRAGCPGHRLHNRLDLGGQPLDPGEVHAKHLDANGRSYAGR